MFNRLWPSDNKTTNYQSEPYDAYQDGNRKIFVGVGATREVNSKMPFYCSDIQSEPYKLYVLTHSSSDDVGKLSVLSAKVTFPDSGTVELVRKNFESSC